jgi:hypothetical protein
MGLQSPALDDRQSLPISFPLQIKINPNEKKFKLGVDNVKRGIHRGQAKQESMAAFGEMTWNLRQQHWTASALPLPTRPSFWFK